MVYFDFKDAETAIEEIHKINFVKWDIMYKFVLVWFFFSKFFFPIGFVYIFLLSGIFFCGGINFIFGMG